MLEFLGLFSNSPELNFLDCLRTVHNLIFETVLDNPGMNFGTIFGKSRTEILGLFLGSLGTDFQTVISPCMLFLFVIAKKMNNMLVV